MRYTARTRRLLATALAASAVVVLLAIASVA